MNNSIFKAIGNSGRLKVFKKICQLQAVDVTTLVKETGLKQPNVSHHLETLRKAKLIVTTRIMDGSKRTICQPNDRMLKGFVLGVCGIFGVKV